MKIDSLPLSVACDYSTVSELPGSGATLEQLARLYHRYNVARQRVADKRVLEVGCGSGMGLGYMAHTAQSVVGGDYTGNLVQIAQSHYLGRVPLVRLDAHCLPFRANAFDVVVIFEAIYYLAHAEQFVAETHRILSPGGMLLIGTVNKDWSECAPSPFSTRYFSSPELRDLLTQAGFTNLEYFGAFPVAAMSLKQRIVSLIRRVVVTLNLMPKTLAGRERFKRIFYGSLAPLPPEITDGMAELYPLVPIPADIPSTDFKVLYAVARS